MDLTRQPAGGFAAMFLALLGAEVLRFESVSEPSGLDDDARAYLSQGKRVRFLDLSAGASWDEIVREAKDADVVLEDGLTSQAAGSHLRYEEVAKKNPRVVFASIRPFGGEGPRSGWRSSELVSQAMGGVLAASGHAGAPPQMLAGFQAAHVAGVHAAILTLASALPIKLGARKGGVHIDLSMQEVMSSHWTREIGRYVYTGEETVRPGEQLGLQGFPQTALAGDGYLFLLALRAEWATLARFLGLDAFAAVPWDDPEYRTLHWDEVQPHFADALRAKGRYEWFAEAAEMGWTLAPIDDPLSILSSPQLRHRGFIQSTSAGGLSRPGLPFPWHRPAADSTT